MRHRGANRSRLTRNAHTPHSRLPPSTTKAAAAPRSCTDRRPSPKFRSHRRRRRRMRASTRSLTVALASGQEPSGQTSAVQSRFSVETFRPSPTRAVPPKAGSNRIGSDATRAFPDRTACSIRRSERSRRDRNIDDDAPWRRQIASVTQSVHISVDAISRRAGESE